MSDVKHAAGLAYREAGGRSERVALLVHGYPESSYMWRHALPALAAAGWQAVAPDLPGYGDSDPQPPATWERHIEALDRFVCELDLGPVMLVTHDWGVMIGLRWVPRITVFSSDPIIRNPHPSGGRRPRARGST